MDGQGAKEIAARSARCQELESRYTHLEHVVEALNEVVIEQSRRLTALERKLAAVKLQVENLGPLGGEARTLEDDKPPHY